MNTVSSTGERSGPHGTRRAFVSIDTVQPEPPLVVITIYRMPGHLIRRLQQISASVFSERMKAIDVDLTSPQYAALAALAEHPGIDQATLAGLIAHDRPTIGGVVERLATKGYVERCTSTTDRRAKRLELTRAGATLLERVDPVVAALQDEILPGLSRSERREFVRLAAKVADAGNERSRAPLTHRTCAGRR